MSLSSKFPDSPSDIIWIQTAFLGDVVLNTGAFELAQKRFPGVRQHVVTTAVGARVLADLESVFSTIVFEKRKWNPIGAMIDVSRKLKSKLADRERACTVQPHRSIRSSLLANFLGFPVATYFETNFGFFGARTSRVGVFHEAVRSAMPLELLGASRVEICAVKPKLAARKIDASVPWQGNLFALRQKSNSLIIGVAPGSQWGTKRWTREGYSELCRKILQNTDWPEAQIVLIGGPDEKPLCEEVLAGAGNHARVINLAGETKIDDLRILFPLLDLLVGNDSSPTQFASAFNVPTVAVFGATTSAMGFGPLADRSQVVEMINLECRPCSDHGPQVCPLKHFKCMRDLTAESVYAACTSVLSSRK